MHARFDEDGFVIKNDGGDDQDKRGEPIWPVETRRPLEDRVRETLDEPPALFIDATGNPAAAATANGEQKGGRWIDDHERRVLYLPASNSILWKPTAVCVDGEYFFWLLGHDG